MKQMTRMDYRGPLISRMPGPFNQEPGGFYYV